MNSATAAVTVTADQKQSAGVRLYEDGRYEEAFVVLAAALRQSEDTPWHLWNDWSAAAFACNQMEKAEAGLKHALALNEKSVEVRANLGGLLLKLGRTAEAIPYLEVAASQSTGLHLIAIQQLLSSCRQKESSAHNPETVPENENHSSPSACTAPAAAAPEPQPHWFPDITGWFREDEALHLFTAIQLARPAKILEIGTFYGRSTATICAAIKALRRPIEFITCDLDFRSEEEFAQMSESVHRGGQARLPFQCHEAFAVGVSTLAYAHRELERHGLAGCVRFEAGDFRRVRGRFGFIFADVLHDQEEIARNLQAIVTKLDDDGILAVHDFNEENRATIRCISAELQFISKHANLGFYRIDRENRKSAKTGSRT